MASLFETITLSDGSAALGTRSTSTNIHTHLVTASSGDWSDYEFAGVLLADHKNGRIGVTILSDYPASDRYYRMRSYRGNAFHLASHPDGEVWCEGTTTSDVAPVAGHWYQFRLQAFADGSATHIRAKVWETGTAESEGWQIDCLDHSASRSRGAPGVWSMGAGLKLWDDLEVVSLSETGEVAPVPASPDPDSSEPEPELSDPDPSFDPETFPAGTTLYFESFDAIHEGEDPLDWFDTARRNSMNQDDSLFKVFELEDGSAAFGTTNTKRNIHSHLLGNGSPDWSGYEYSGAMMKEDPNGSFGVTIYSDYPASDGYYRLRSHQMGPFDLSYHPNQNFECEGIKTTSYSPQPGAWYEFRLQAFAVGSGTRLRAKIWRTTDREPLEWQIDCVDQAATFTRGVPGVWSMGPGLKLWDDLEVTKLD